MIQQTTVNKQIFHLKKSKDIHDLQISSLQMNSYRYLILI